MVDKRHGRFGERSESVRNHQELSPRSNTWDHASDLAVTARELNAGAGVGRLPEFRDLRRLKSVVR